MCQCHQLSYIILSVLGVLCTLLRYVEMLENTNLVLLNAKMFQEENRTIPGAVEGSMMENETQTRPLVLNLSMHRK